MYLSPYKNKKQKKNSLSAKKCIFSFGNFSETSVVKGNMFWSVNDFSFKIHIRRAHLLDARRMNDMQVKYQRKEKT